MESSAKRNYEFHILPHTVKQNTDEKIIRSMYPHYAVELKVLFVYGADYKREMNIFFVPQSVRIAAALFLSFIFVAATVLYVIRRKLECLKNDFPSAVIDCWIPFIGGGNLRMEHRLERLFFAILLFGAFFIMSVFSGDLLDCVVRVLNTKISTFSELADINPPIYSNLELYLHKDLIHEKLK